jgi:hypothetical protein
MDAGLLSGEEIDLKAVHFSSEFQLAKEHPGIFIHKEYVGEKMTQVIHFVDNHKQSHFF